jgi:hypothetical protein
VSEKDRHRSGTGPWEERSARFPARRRRLLVASLALAGVLADAAGGRAASGPPRRLDVGHEMKRMPLTDAAAISMCMFVIEPR